MKNNSENTFRTFIQERDENVHDKLVVLMYLAEQKDSLNETELVEGMKDWLDKVGLKIHKGNGIIDYISQFTKGAGKLILASIKGDKAEVKKIAKSLDKADVIDFLLKLDMATMHIVTGPIHFIDAVTGWDLTANLNQAAHTSKGMITAFHKAIETVKSTVKKLVSPDKQKLITNMISGIENVIPSN